MQKEDCIASGILSCLLCVLDLHCAQSIPSYRQHKMQFEVATSLVGTAGSAPDCVRLEVLGEGSTRSKDDSISKPWCESEDV